MTIDVESNLREPLVKSEPSQRAPTGTCGKWKLLLASFAACFGLCFVSSRICTVELGTALSIPKKWNIPPIHPLHHGKVVYLSYKDPEGSTQYKRIVTAPCAYGMLLFNIGPAKSFEPFAYDVYDDAYAYSDNKGLCVLYPSYTGTQTADHPFWTDKDPTEQEVNLGDQENKISSRIVTPPNAKDNAKRGGDFLIIRKGNFYDPHYYQQLKQYVNGFPSDADVQSLMAEFTPEISSD